MTDTVAELCPICNGSVTAAGAERLILVVGTNLAGRHGRGAANHALRRHGAAYGNGAGLQGDSYGLPTKDGYVRTLPLREVALFVAEFRVFAEEHCSWRFAVTAVGCGLAGYVPEDIAPMFAGAPANCVLPAEFVRVLEGRG